MKRISGYLLCLLVLVTSACGDNTSNGPDSSSTADSPAAENSSTVDVVNLSDEALTQLTREAFTFAFPLVEQYRMQVALTHPQSPAFSADFNQFGAVRALQGPEDTLVIRPNADTLYAGVILDVRTEPMVIAVPEMEDSRYYSVQLIDSHTHNFGYIGTRTTGNGAGQFMIAGPNWRGETPVGITQLIRTESFVPMGLIRIEVKGEDDLQRVHTLQDAFAVTPLSEFLGNEAPADAPPLSWVAPIGQGNEWNPDFIKVLRFIHDELIEAHPTETALFERYLSLEALLDDPAKREIIRAAAEQQYQAIVSNQDQLGQMVNGWLLTSAIFGNREHMQGKYQMRAEATYYGLWGNDLEEAYYPTAMHDANGEPLDASMHNYVLHFTAGQLPNAKGFWSLTMYNEAQLMHANELNRYVVGDRSAHLQYGEDGSLTIYLQHENPGADKESNWLPTNNGPFTLTMRIYIPEDTGYQPPALQTAD
jgi:hypothetical protein